ncbi:MAG: hypothetical protein NG747_10605 [Candidatus Brocadia sp.]|nr:hypothetical protein [Candidatus Brocadia sp.]
MKFLVSPSETVSGSLRSRQNRWGFSCQISVAQTKVGGYWLFCAIEAMSRRRSLKVTTTTIDRYSPFSDKNGLFTNPLGFVPQPNQTVS